MSERQDVREGKGPGVRDKGGGKYSKGERKSGRSRKRGRSVWESGRKAE